MKYLAKLQNNLEYKIEEKKGDFFINGEKIEFDWRLWSVCALLLCTLLDILMAEIHIW